MHWFPFQCTLKRFRNKDITSVQRKWLFVLTKCHTDRDEISSWLRSSKKIITSFLSNITYKESWCHVYFIIFFNCKRNNSRTSVKLYPLFSIYRIFFILSHFYDISSKKLIIYLWNLLSINQENLPIVKYFPSNSTFAPSIHSMSTFLKHKILMSSLIL